MAQETICHMHMTYFPMKFQLPPLDPHSEIWINSYVYGLWLIKASVSNTLPTENPCDANNILLRMYLGCLVSGNVTWLEGTCRFGRRGTCDVMFAPWQVTSPLALGFPPCTRAPICYSTSLTLCLHCLLSLYYHELINTMIAFTSDQEWLTFVWDDMGYGGNSEWESSLLSARFVHVSQKMPAYTEYDLQLSTFKPKL